MRAHPSEEDLAAAAEGKLPPEERAALLRHINEECLACLAVYEATLSQAAVASTMGNGSGAPPRTGWVPPATCDEFEILRLLGTGAMGQVYLGRDVLLDRPVAIKFIVGSHAGPAARQRFLIEARAIARLGHPNVLSIHRIGEIEGRPYIVSELVRGKRLDQLPMPLPWQRVLRLGLDLARGLGSAHRRGVLHRDIKPANAILTDEDQVKLLDFGLAKLFDVPGEAGGLRQGERTDASPLHIVEGALIGTPQYMAPEALFGEPAACETDVFSVGVVLYELCTGALPRQGRTLTELREAARRETPSFAEHVPDVDARLAAVVHRCLRQDPRQRYRSGEELYLALSEIQDAASVTVPAGNPYRGLRVFEAQHQALFFGRGGEINALLERLATTSLVVVAGDSGVGKSSLCRAGVLPRLAQGFAADGRAWSSAELLPGRRPIGALAAALGPFLASPEEKVLALCAEEPAALGRALGRALGTDRGVVLFIDQLEELLTQSAIQEARAFGEAVGALGDRIPGVRVLAAVRGDCLTRMAVLPGIGRDLVTSLFLLRPLSADALREVIEGPARLHQIAFESDALVEELVGSMAQAEGGLPLLEFALAELWEARDQARRLIQSLALRSIGGVAGALSRHADGVLAALLPVQRDSARRMLIRLVTAEGDRIRRGVAELLSEAPADQVALDALVRGRLLVVREGAGEGGSYEIAHEALVRGWDTLRGWLGDDEERRRLSQRVAAAVAEWVRTGEGRSALWDERRLSEVEAAGIDAAELPRRERDFLAASLREVTRRRRLRIVGLTGFVTALALLSAGALGWRQKNELAQKKDGLWAAALARQPGQETAALVRGIGAVAPGGEPRRRSPAEALAGLTAAVEAGRRSLPLRDHRDVVHSASFSPDGGRLVSASEETEGRLWDARTGRLIARLVGHSGEISALSFSPGDGRIIATASADTTAKLWDGRTGRHLRDLLGHKAHIPYLAFSPDGQRLVTGCKDYTAHLWEVATGRRIAVLARHTFELSGVAFSPDGNRIVTVSLDGTARLWDGQDGRFQVTLTGHRGYLRGAAFSPDGMRVVTAGEDHTARLWNSQSGAQLLELSGHRGVVLAARFSADGSRVLTSSTDGTTRLWDSRSGVALVTMAGVAGPFAGAQFFADGQRVLTTSSDGTARVWDAETGHLLASLRGHGGALSSAAISLDGTTIATASQDRTLRLWSGQVGWHPGLLRGHSGSLWATEFSPDGATVVTASHDGLVRLWDRATGRPLRMLREHTARVFSAAFSPDGQWLVSGSADKTARLWEVSSGRVLAVLRGHEDRLTSTGFSPDGSRILTTSADGTARLWDSRSGRPLEMLRVPEGSINQKGVFSPDGHRVMVIGGDRTVRLWDPATGHVIAIPGSQVALSRAVFSREGDWIATAGDDGAARLYDGRTGTKACAMLIPNDQVWAVAFSPRSALVATGTRWGNLALWRREGCGLIATLQEHGNLADDVAFSHDGERLATTGDDLTVRLWDGRTGRPLRIMAGHTAAVRTLRFSPDGGRLLSGARDGTARLWDGRTGEMLRPSVTDGLLLPVEPEDLGPPDSLGAAPAPLGATLPWACRILAVQRPHIEREFREALPQVEAACSLFGEGPSWRAATPAP